MISLNLNVLPRFARGGESWEQLVARVTAALADHTTHRDVHDCLISGRFVPGGQIWRGAGHSNAILYNCFVTSADPAEEATSIAERVSGWTRRGCGVGVNISAWAQQQPVPTNQALHTLIHSIALSQQRLWDAGITRTATMANIDFGTPGCASVCRLLAARPEYRHLNVAVMIPDIAMESIVAAAEVGDDTPHLRELATLCLIAWETGNPGVVFTDRVNEDHPFDERIDGCNPCAEQHLLPNEGCNIGSLNLAAFVRDRLFDWELYRYTIATAIGILDAVIDVSAFPCHSAGRLATQRRRVGLGIMGLASALGLMGMDYDCEGARDFSIEAARHLDEAAHAASAVLAQTKGPSEAGFTPYLRQSRRNLYLTSIAPTGAVSLLWNVSSGIEPPITRRQLSHAGQSTSARKAASEIPWNVHLDILAIWQARIDGGISKTVNLPEKATVADVFNVFCEAWRMRCKGISVYRTGSRAGR